MSSYTIVIADGVKVVTAADLDSMTPYILLEHEDWFEDEIAFVRAATTPNTRAFDIGANHGVYALSMAARLGPEGHVWAFEPSRTPMAMLTASVAENRFQDRITPLGFGLSDRAGPALLGVSKDSERNSLQTQGGETEEILLDTLDAVWDRLGKPAIDIIKLDAEGEEEKILDGGARFFAECSPLVMFELRNEHDPNVGLLDMFEAVGYVLYALVPGLQLLVPFDRSRDIDPFLFNLFACKADRAERLAERGLLVAQASEPPLSRPLPDVMEHLSRCAFAAAFAASWVEHASRPAPSTELAMARYLASQEAGRPAAERWALLRGSVAGFEAAAREDNHPTVALGQLRALRGLGRSRAAADLARRLQENRPAVAAALTERPFLPPLPAWDKLPVQGGPGEWCAAMLADAVADTAHFSTYFDAAGVTAVWEVRFNPNCTVSMYRRLILAVLRAGRRIGFGPGERNPLLEEVPEHRNVSIWSRLLSG